MNSLLWVIYIHSTHYSVMQHTTQASGTRGSTQRHMHSCQTLWYYNVHAVKLHTARVCTLTNYNGKVSIAFCFLSTLSVVWLAPFCRTITMGPYRTQSMWPHKSMTLYVHKCIVITLKNRVGHILLYWVALLPRPKRPGDKATNTREGKGDL